MTEKDARNMQAALAKPFAPEDLEWRLQNTIEESMRGMAVPYVTNRAIQNRLDEVCGPENWYNEFKPWHSNGKKDAQLCGIAIYFEGKGFITKWDGAEDSDIEPIKGGLSDSMKRAAYQWGIGRVLYSLDTVWVDIERRGRSYIIKASERKKLDDAYLNALKKLGLEPAAASGIQSLLMPKTAPEQKAAGDKQLASAPVQDQRSGGTAQQSAEPQNRSAQQKPQAGPKKQEYASEPTGKTVPFRNTAQAMPEEDIYTVLAAKVQGGMSGSNTLINLETPEKKQTYAYVRGVRPELTPGTQLSHVRLTTRKQDMVVRNITDLNRLYAMYEQGDKSVYAVFSKERARDGYMRGPAVRWNRRRRAFLCPDCDAVIEMDISEDGISYTVPADQFFFRKENRVNHVCAHCGTPLWSAVNPSKRTEWVKIGEYGWVHRYGAAAHLERTKNEKVIDQLMKIAEDPDGYYPVRGAQRRYPLSTYIKKKLRGKISGFLCDELHEYNNASGQGDAMAELYGASKLFVGMTATLINGYSSGKGLLPKHLPHE